MVLFGGLTAVAYLGDFGGFCGLVGLVWRFGWGASGVTLDFVCLFLTLHVCLGWVCFCMIFGLGVSLPV